MANQNMFLAGLANTGRIFQGTDNGRRKSTKQILNIHYGNQVVMFNMLYTMIHYMELFD